MKHLCLLAKSMIFAIGAGRASAQGNGLTPAAPRSAGPIGVMPMQHQAGMHEGIGGPAMMHGAGQPIGRPIEAGQAAFGAIEEIVRMLLTDPITNWSRVDIDDLRQHLVDMDELTLHGDAKKSQSRTACAFW